MNASNRSEPLLSWYWARPPPGRRARVAGGYFAFALMFLTRLDAAAPRDRVIRSAIAVVAGIVLCVMGLLLERACKVTEPEEGAAADEGTTWRPTRATEH